MVEGETLEKNHSNSLFIAIRNIWLWAHENSGCSRQDFNNVCLLKILSCDFMLLKLCSRGHNARKTTFRANYLQNIQSKKIAEYAHRNNPFSFGSFDKILPANLPAGWYQVVLKFSWGRILGRSWDKSLESFPLCYSVFTVTSREII
jgi:hypothetical protein